jgi:N-acyl-L-homoserine lactone synthetase
MRAGDHKIQIGFLLCFLAHVRIVTDQGTKNSALKTTEKVLRINSRIGFTVVVIGFKAIRIKNKLIVTVRMSINAHH